MTRILFVCTGNICRSPTADGVMRTLRDQHKLKLEIDSAGTHDYHVGDAPDPRSQRTALAAGHDISSLRARNVIPSDFDEFDLILGMDQGHVRALEALKPEDSTSTVALFLDYAGHPSASEVPDPYYGAQAGFDLVLQLCEEGCEALIQKLTS